MTIPGLDPMSGYLPPGIHPTNWKEAADNFATNETRRRLFKGLQRAGEALRAAGCKRLYVGGSFVTSKDEPNDFDGCWELEGVDWEELDPVLLEFADSRRAQKAKFGGELFPANASASPSGTRFVDFFQYDRNGIPKGIIAIDL